MTGSARKRLKGARDIILIHNTVYLGDQYMNDGRKKKQKQSETRFPTYMFNCTSPSVAPHNIIIRIEHC